MFKPIFRFILLIFDHKVKWTRIAPRDKLWFKSQLRDVSQLRFNMITLGRSHFKIG
jgi:hypothetical protein